jgi:5-oxoprolinase (ATP-hydrolysing) subunit C
MSLFVLDAGLASRVVDMGRPSCRRLGVAVGGAADRAALALGNALVGNAPAMPALEICLKGPVLRAETRLGGVLYGAPFTLTSARQQLRPGLTFTLEVGEEIHIGGVSQDLRAYLCVPGGLGVSEILGSFSGLENIKAGDILPSRESSLRKRFLSPAIWEQLRDGRNLLRVVPGLQADWFEENDFCDQEFTVTPALDRMGIRLSGQPLRLPERELISEPVCPGSVQVTRDGQCIILGIDGQTIGGYPKIAQIIQADLDHLGQLRRGDMLRFRKVNLAEAFDMYRRRQIFLNEWCVRGRISLDSL